MLRALESSDIDVASWPPAEFLSVSEEQLKQLSVLEAMCKRPPRKSKAKGKAKGKASVKRRRPKSDSDS